MSSVPKTTKKVAKKTDDVAVAVAAPVAAAAAAAPAAKATKAKKDVTAAATTTAKVAATSTPVAAVGAAAAAGATAGATTAAGAATTAAVTEVEEVRLESEAKAITARLLAVRETVSELISEAKRLEKKAAKLQKVADKRRRRKVEPEEGKPARVSIFQIPTNISPALCAFMGRPAGSQESRSNVTKFVTTYVKEKNLKDKHTIKPDTKLKALLGVAAEDTLTYFNLQRYLNRHYLKATPAVATA